MECGDGVKQLLEGTWAALYGRHAAELVFYRVPHSSIPLVEGFMIYKNNLLQNDCPKAKREKIKVD